MVNKIRLMIFELAILLIIGLVSELINLNLISKPYQDFSYNYSVSLIIVFIAIYRWGLKGLITAPIMGLISVLLMEDIYLHTFLIAVIGNLGIITGYLYLKLVDRNKLLCNQNWILLYILSGNLGVFIVKFIFSILGNLNITDLIINSLVNTFVFTIFFLFLRKQKNILIDMNKTIQELKK